MSLAGCLAFFVPFVAKLLQVCVEVGCLDIHNPLWQLLKSLRDAQWCLPNGTTNQTRTPRHNRATIVANRHRENSTRFHVPFKADIPIRFWFNERLWFQSCSEQNRSSQHALGNRRFIVAAPIRHHALLADITEIGQYSSKFFTHRHLPLVAGLPKQPVNAPRPLMHNRLMLIPVNQHHARNLCHAMQLGKVRSPVDVDDLHMVAD